MSDSQGIEPARGQARVKISVIVPVYNDEARLALCVDALRNQTLDASAFHVVVVDNGSDHPPRVDLAENMSMITEPTPGSYAARNRGIRSTRSDYIAFTDADCTPEPDWLENGCSYLDANPGIDMIGGRIDVYITDPEHPSGTELYVTSIEEPSHFVSHDRFAATANVIVRRSLIDEVGPFVEALKSGGDLEFGNRVVTAGYSLTYVDEVRVRTPARSSIGEYAHKVRRTLAGRRDLARYRGDPFPFPMGTSLRGFLPPVPTVTRALRNHRTGSLARRVKHATAIVAFHYVKAVERFRLRFDNRSPR